MKKIGLFFGGLSNEAEVSIRSAINIADNIDKNKFELILIYWHKNGNFYKLGSFDEIKSLKTSKLIPINKFKNLFDLAFPITHGRYGEDGALQGIFESLKIKYCGCQVLSSALCMDKAVFKTFMGGLGIRQTKFLIFEPVKKEVGSYDKKIYREIRGKIPFPVFIKPANSGSSVGISKVTDREEIRPALLEALKHDKKIVVEQGLIRPREIEVAVIGNGRDLTISDPGELIPSQEFYNYDDKYKLGKTEIIIPALLSKKIKKEIVKLAERSYVESGCSGFVRIDFFVSGNRVYLNEINTLPGFTSSSMFPMLMMEKGMSYRDLITKIIDLAK